MRESSDIRQQSEGEDESGEVLGIETMKLLVAIVAPNPVSNILLSHPV